MRDHSPLPVFSSHTTEFLIGGKLQTRIDTDNASLIDQPRLGEHAAVAEFVIGIQSESQSRTRRLGLLDEFLAVIG